MQASPSARWVLTDDGLLACVHAGSVHGGGRAVWLGEFGTWPLCWAPGIARIIIVLLLLLHGLCADGFLLCAPLRCTGLGLSYVLCVQVFCMPLVV